MTYLSGFQLQKSQVRIWDDSRTCVVYVVRPVRSDCPRTIRRAIRTPSKPRRNSSVFAHAQATSQRQRHDKGHTQDDELEMRSTRGDRVVIRRKKMKIARFKLFSPRVSLRPPHRTRANATKLFARAHAKGREASRHPDIHERLAARVRLIARMTTPAATPPTSDHRR